jgi:hypothetical protein
VIARGWLEYRLLKHRAMTSGIEKNLAFIFDGRFGVVVGILPHYARGRGFDSCTVQTFVCMNMSVCVLGVSMYNMYLQKNFI